MKKRTELLISCQIRWKIFMQILNENSFRVKFWEKAYIYVYSGVTGRGAECPPETSDQEISADLPGKERLGKKGKWSRKEGKFEKGRWKSYKTRRGPFCFSLFKPLKFVLGLPKWESSTGKKHFTPGKNGKITLPPLKNFALMPLYVYWMFQVRFTYGESLV